MSEVRKSTRKTKVHDYKSLDQAGFTDMEANEFKDCVEIAGETQNEQTVSEVE